MQEDAEELIKTSEDKCVVQTDLSSIVVDDEALVPAVEVLMGVDLHAELLQHGLVGSLSYGMHGGAHVIQDTHDTRWILRLQEKQSISQLVLKLIRRIHLDIMVADADLFFGFIFSFYRTQNGSFG